MRLGDFRESLDLVRGEKVAGGVDRVGREIEAERLTLGSHAVRKRPRRIARQPDRRQLLGGGAEQRRLSARPLVVRAGGVREDCLGGGEHRRAIGLDRIEGAGGGEAFELAAVQEPRVDPRGEILEAGEGAATLPLRDQRLHRLLADALERAERVAHRAVFDREEGVAGVDVGRQALDGAAPHILDLMGAPPESRARPGWERLPSSAPVSDPLPDRRA